MRLDRIIAAVSGVFSAVSLIVAVMTPSAAARTWAVVGSVVFGLVCLGIVVWELVQAITHHGRRIGPRTEEVSTDPHRALVMSLQDERLDVFQHDAWILQVKVSVWNRDRIQHRLNGPWELTNIRPVGAIPGLSHEIDRVGRDRPLPASVIENGKTVEGWFIGKIAYTPVEGVPNYQLTVQAETGYDYGFRRIGDPKLPIESPPLALAPLQPRHEQREPYEHVRYPGRPPDVHFVGIYNPHVNAAVMHVRLEIVDTSPHPRDDQGSPPEFPAMVPMKTGGDHKSGRTLDPGTEELWEIATTYPDGQGQGNFLVQGVALTHFPFGRNVMWAFQRDERWRLRFQVSADGMPSQLFSVVMEAMGDAIRCHIEGATP